MHKFLVVFVSPLKDILSTKLSIQLLLFYIHFYYFYCCYFKKDVLRGFSIFVSTNRKIENTIDLRCINFVF